MGMRNGGIVPLILDGNSWIGLTPDNRLFGTWPPKRLRFLNCILKRDKTTGWQMFHTMFFKISVG